ncbi:MAG: ABC transporter permease [Candidatus Zixiibacteriota bacterium]
MNKLWTLIKREYAQVVKKKSFFIGILLTPVFMVAIIVLPSLLAREGSSDTEKVAIIDLGQQGIGQKLADKLKEYKIDDDRPTYEITKVYDIPYDDSVQIIAARAELDSMILNKKLRYYLLIDKDILTNDSCFMIAKSFGFESRSQFNYSLTNILSAMRLERSEINIPTDSVLQLTRRVSFEHQTLSGESRDFMSMYLGGIIFVMIIFGSVINFGQVLMRSVIEEKNSRIVEVIASSVTPFQMMTGKIIGLGLASLTQILIWFVMGFVLYSMRGSFDVPAEIMGTLFNPVFIFFFISYMIVGYLLFSSLFALIGSIVNSDKEAQGFMMPITMTLLSPMFVAIHVVQNPDSVLSTVMSFIPFITPTMMVLRLNFAGVDSFDFANPMIVQAFLGLILTIVTLFAVIWIVSKIFRVGILMYGKRPTLPEIIKWMRYK